MTDGMKSGSGSDPFGNESDDSTSEDTDNANQEEESIGRTQPDAEEQKTTSETRSSTSSAASDREELPYIFARSNVKADRTMVQYFLREETEQVESDVERRLEQELGTDVLLTDIREALVRVGAHHLDEVADELRDWGYRYEEDSN